MITHGRLLELLSYDPGTGVFLWKNPVSMASRRGGIAGTKIGKYYTQIMIDHQRYSAHRLAWFYMTGEWPEMAIDHKDHAFGDRFSNLRIASTRQNAYNIRPQYGTTSKWKGVRFDGGRKKCWKIAFSRPDGVRVQKRFSDEREAAEEYMFLALEHHGEFTRLE